MQSMFGRIGWVLAAAVWLAGCAPVAVYNPAQVPPVSFDESERVDGRVLVYTDRTEDETPFVGPPTSFTGSATKLSIPLALIAREIAHTTFGKMFRGGADKANAPPAPGAYRVVLRPRVRQFTYAYNQLKNLGFAITPQVTLTLEMQVFDDQGRVAWERSYDSGLVEMPAYLMSGDPGGEIGKGVHKALGDLMVKAARDVRERLQTPAPAPAPGSPA